MHGQGETRRGVGDWSRRRRSDRCTEGSAARPSASSPASSELRSTAGPAGTHLGLPGFPRRAQHRLLRILRLLPGGRLRSLRLAFTAILVLLLVVVFLPGGVVPPEARLVPVLVLLRPETEPGRHGKPAEEKESERNAGPARTKPEHVGRGGGGGSPARPALFLRRGAPLGSRLLRAVLAPARPARGQSTWGKRGGNSSLQATSGLSEIGSCSCAS